MKDLPAYGKPVLIWYYKQWRVGYRIKTDMSGEHYFVFDKFGNIPFIDHDAIWRKLPEDPTI